MDTSTQDQIIEILKGGEDGRLLFIAAWTKCAVLGDGDNAVFLRNLIETSWKKEDKDIMQPIIDVLWKALYDRHPSKELQAYLGSAATSVVVR